MGVGLAQFYDRWIVYFPTEFQTVIDCNKPVGRRSIVCLTSQTVPGYIFPVLVVSWHTNTKRHYQQGVQVKHECDLFYCLLTICRGGGGMEAVGGILCRVALHAITNAL